MVLNTLSRSFRACWMATRASAFHRRGHPYEMDVVLVRAEGVSAFLIRLADIELVGHRGIDVGVGRVIVVAGLDQNVRAHVDEVCRSDTVGTVNKSIAAMSSLWFRKNATQRFTWSGSAGSHGMYRDTVFSEMMKRRTESRLAPSPRRSALHSSRGDWAAGSSWWASCRARSAGLPEAPIPTTT